MVSTEFKIEEPFENVFDVNEVEGDGIESRLPFKTFSTLHKQIMVLFILRNSGRSVTEVKRANAHFCSLHKNVCTKLKIFSKLFEYKKP